jgi:hypothetical protein
MSLPPAPSSGMSPLRIVGLVLLAGVVLCGLVGSCLLVLALFVPFFQQ